MARWRSAIAALLGPLTFASTVTAQVVTFARTDYRSDTGARGMVAADLNRDGWLDLAHANVLRNTVTILLSQHGTGFVRAGEVPVGLGPFALTTADFNRDDIPDLAVANASGSTMSILLGRGNGSFVRTDIDTPAQGPRGIAAADVNTDGRVDLVVTGFDSGTVQLWLGNGTGGFVRSVRMPVPAQPQGVAVGDFDHRGHPDVAVASAGGLALLANLGATTRSVRTLAAPAPLNVLAVGDLNDDGWDDVAAASTAHNVVVVYLGTVAGLTFSRSYAVGASPRGLTLADVNDDGLLDIVTANRDASTVSLLTGDRSHPGVFHTARAPAAAAGSRAVVSGDFNADGRIDLATGNEQAAAVSVLANTTLFKQAAFSFKSLTIPSDTALRTGDRNSPLPQIAASDFNRDGQLDFAVPADPGFGSDGVVIVMRNGSTQLLSGPSPLTRFLVDDFNADGNADVLLYSADPEVSTPSTRFVSYLGDGRGHFTTSPTTVASESYQWCGAGDLNGDARPDLVCEGRVLLGTGKGTFVAAGPGPETGLPGVFFVDVNRDGKLDVVTMYTILLGDGAGGLTPSTAGTPFPASAVADLNHDGFMDLVGSQGMMELGVYYGSAEGFRQADESLFNFEEYGQMVVGDINVDGWPDIVVNGSPCCEDPYALMLQFGHPDGTFNEERFVLGHVLVVMTDVNRDGLPDLVDYDAHALHVLLNERNETNHPPVMPSFSLTTGQGSPRIDTHVTDPDQQLVSVTWYDSTGERVGSNFGADVRLYPDLPQPGTYTFRGVATDTHGAMASGTVTVTYAQTLKEIVLYAAAPNVRMTGHWMRVADPTAAGGVRAYDVNLGAPKVAQPDCCPASALIIPFVADQNLTYKLWIRLKAASDFWANDSIWVGDYFAFGPVAVSLEPCVGCGVSGWGWRDNTFGANANTNGPLVQFWDHYPQELVISTREDGVSIDQIVLSAEKYLTHPPGAMRNDQTILPATQPAP